MPTILDSATRREVRARFGIDPFVLDHAVKAYDCLIVGDGDGYKRSCADANEAMGFEGPITEGDRPTAVDRVFGICSHVYAKLNNVDERLVLPELKRRSGITS